MDFLQEIYSNQVSNGNVYEVKRYYTLSQATINANCKF